MNARASATVVRVAAAILCVFGLAVIVKELAPAIRIFPSAAALALALQLPLVVIGFWLFRLLRPVAAPARWWSAAAVVWGMTAAVGCALLANHGLLAIWAKTRGISFASNWAAALTAPLDEEVLKVCGVALLVLAVPLTFRGPIDGLVFGALTGLGFEAMENFIYGLNMIVQSGAADPRAAVTRSAVVRVAVTGPGSHWAMTAVAGAGIGFLVARGRRRAWPAVGLLLAAMAMHWLFDSPQPASLVIKVAVNFIAVAILYLALRRGYLAQARGVLAADRAAGTVTRDEARSLLSRRSRRGALHRVPRGPERDRLSARQQALLVRLEERVADHVSLPPAPLSPAEQDRAA
jgi:RsiW-degrading membrane proteinase PrsW (M82 family)